MRWSLYALMPFLSLPPLDDEGDVAGHLDRVDWRDRYAL